jgi:hypothetical protein
MYIFKFRCLFIEYLYHQSHLYEPVLNILDLQSLRLQNIYKR